MNRRTFLGGLGLLGSLGVVAADRSSAAGSIDVAVWFSERAAGYEGLEDRIRGYLGGALESVGVDAAFAFADRPLRLDDEQGAHLMTVEWPGRVLGGALGVRPIGPTGDVNLLVTDGDPTSRPAGYGMDAIAAMTGARLLAEMAPPDDTPAVVRLTGPALVTQLLLHECGHALGLDHRHGSVTVEGGALVASPMVGAYAWAADDVRRRQLGRRTNTCGSPFTMPRSRGHRLQLAYGPCASRHLREHGGVRLV